MDIGGIWELIILKPMINTMISLSQVLWGSFGLTIIILTLVARGVMFPLTRKQLRASKAMQTLQPKLTALQKKHGADKRSWRKSKCVFTKSPVSAQLVVWDQC